MREMTLHISQAKRGQRTDHNEARRSQSEVPGISMERRRKENPRRTGWEPFQKEGL